MEHLPHLLSCRYCSCLDCLQQYLLTETSKSAINIRSPECCEAVHPNDIRMILNNRDLLNKYYDFMACRVLARDPDARWCPAPDSSFMVLVLRRSSNPEPRLCLCQPTDSATQFSCQCRQLWPLHPICNATPVLHQLSDIIENTKWYNVRLYLT